MSNNMILILDFSGSQSQSIARKVRGERVYCEVVPYTVSIDVVREKNPRGIMMIGNPRDISDDTPGGCAQAVYQLGVPVLAIGSAALLLARDMGARLLGPVMEKRTAQISFAPTPLFKGLGDTDRYFDRVDALDLPEGFSAIASGSGLTAAFACEERGLYGLQFFPEQNDPDGLAVIHNFAIDICGCEPTWSMEAFIERELKHIRETVGNGRALLAISGGVDSSVCAALMHRAIGRQLICLHVDTGLMRKGETAMVEKMFKQHMDMNLICVDASERFLQKLKGVTDPEKKRKIIGEEFIRVFEEEALKLGKIDFLVQGTIYPDVIESFGVDGTSVKAHHNVGGLPEKIGFEAIIEPVRELFKDEVRAVGTALGLPAELIHRQPFPGPGLAVRTLGEVNREKLDILREADAIFREEIAAAGLDKRIWQYFVVLLDVRSTGVRKGSRSYDYAVALRAINSIDAMSATVYRLPYDLLERVTARITTEVEGINRVVYDITGKPPATIEWE
ncbi:MAG TPA: glutamine-hydrolyzing GMP synthase [Candidatus Ornithocaccomicrobium faecavium]|uniref:GMP synthase (glutamine-hydrolyzing) n=1 Tax=Candidatus Ornithocaccomicrobium faecavium TaxID=2840890 RepID=A0A9D1P727_9FIRM|nr:glutamine-hydrolyzing GMP synthase [Candidatus Ornithocaccomicrobium faecavium]